MGMLNTWFSIWLQRLSVFLLLGFNPVLGQTISLLKDEALLQQRDCVRYCLGGEDNFEDLQNFLGCPDTNVCLCREDIRPSASAALETCIRSVYTTCKSGTDYEAAASIYDRYCSFTAPASAKADPTQTDSGTATVTKFTSAPTVTVSKSSSSNQVSSPSSSEWIFITAATSLFIIIGALATTF